MDEFENISIQEIQKEIISFNNDENVQKLEGYYHSKSFSEIIGVSRKENVHSNFIAWLLNNKESHQLSTFPLEKFLELLVYFSKERQLQYFKELYNFLIVTDYELQNIKVETEKSIATGRVDIYIEAKIKYSDKEENLKIILENKVGSKEQKDQTVRYYKYFTERQTDKDILLFVYLTPLSSLELSELSEPECSSKEYIQINYQSIVDYILEPILKRTLSNKTREIISEYLQSLSQPTLDKEDEEYKQGLIMALGKDERLLLTKFWENNQKLILAALYAISSDPKQEKDVRDNATTAISNLSSSTKDRSLYVISYDNLKTDKIKKSDIGLQTVKIIEKANLMNTDIFNFLKKDKSCGHLLIKRKDEVNETEKKYSRYRVNSEPEIYFQGQGYYIARNWGKENVLRFIKKMKKKFPSLNYENETV